MHQICAQCGAVLKDDVGGLCPNCIARMAFQQDDADGSEAQKPGKGVVHVLGDYELLEEIARGGMGVVYKARQRRLERTVAVKMILAGRFAGTSDLQRFQAEAIAAANLKHRNIVAVHEVGECEGHRYFSMDYVNGRNLAELVGDSPLPAKQAARYVRLIAGAVEYAHDQGIIHRDLKPSNILVDSDDEPKVTDFGLAKRWDGSSDLTLSGQVLGSPNFFPPEQAGGKSKSVGREGDIYSLGAILYFLLTGRPPFLAESLERTLEHVLHTDAAPPSVINPAVPKDLETICLKCLEKDPAGRYFAARALAEDLEHFERDEPIQARPISKSERLGRWCGRNRALAGALGAAAVIFLAGFFGVFWQWRRAEIHAKAETRQRRHLESVLSHKEIQEAQRFFDAGDSSSALARLARILRSDPGNHVAATRLLSALTYRNFALPVAVLEHEASVLTAQFSPNGERVVTGAADGSVRIWAAENGKLFFDLRQHTERVRHAVFSPDGLRVVSASEDTTARIWDARTGQALTPPLRHQARIRRVHFSPDGRRIATASGDATARIWDAYNGNPVTPPLQHSKYVNEAVFSPDGKLVVTASEEGTARVWNAETGQQISGPMHHENDVIFANFSPAGKRILTASVDGTARVWSALTGEPLTPVFAHDGHINFGGFSPDGTKILTASYDDTARLWNAASGELAAPPLVLDANVLRAEFSPDGRQIFAFSDTAGRVWDADTGAPATEPILHEAPFEHIGGVSPDGKRVVIPSILNVAVLWDVRPGKARPNRFSGAHADYGLALSSNGRHIAAGTEGSFDVFVWDVESRERIAGPFGHPGRINWFEFSPDGEDLVTACLDGVVRVWNVRSGDLAKTRSHPSAVHSARYSRDGRRIAVASADKTARIWDASLVRELVSPLRHESNVGRADFSPDGRRVVTASADKTARVWDASSGEPITPPLRHELTVGIACFSPDGRSVLTASEDATARLWDSTTGQPQGRPLAHRGPVRLAQFSPDGMWIVTASADNTVRVWHAQTGKPITEPLKHDRAVRIVHINRDGTRLVTMSEEPATRIWDPISGHLLFDRFPHQGSLSDAPDARFTVDGNSVATVTPDGVLRLWDAPVLPMPVPHWLPELAEAAAAKQFDTDGSAVPVRAQRLVQLREQFRTDSSTNFYSKWARWFFADRETRARSPF